MTERVKTSAIFAEAFRLEGEVKRLQDSLAAANAELAVWRDEDGREAKYEHVSQRCTKAEMRAAKAEAALEAENLGAKAEQARLAEALAAAESERDALRKVLEETNYLLMSVPQHEDWRQIVRRNVVEALYGPAAWKER